MNELLNFHQITENIGTAGQPSAEQLSEIAEEGYTAIVNLSMHDSDNVVPDEAHIVTSMGLSYFHIPVPFDQPTPEHLRKFFGVMELLEDEKALVHCAVNGRVSVFIHQYLTLKKGQTSEQASTPLLKQWRPYMDEAWQSIMDLELSDIEPSAS